MAELFRIAAPECGSIGARALAGLSSPLIWKRGDDDYAEPSTTRPSICVDTTPLVPLESYRSRHHRITWRSATTVRIIGGESAARILRQYAQDGAGRIRTILQSLRRPRRRPAALLRFPAKPDRATAHWPNVKIRVRQFSSPAGQVLGPAKPEVVVESVHCPLTLAASSRCSPSISRHGVPKFPKSNEPTLSDLSIPATACKRPDPCLRPRLNHRVSRWRRSRGIAARVRFDVFLHDSRRRVFGDWPCREREAQVTQTVSGVRSRVAGGMHRFLSKC